MPAIDTIKYFSQWDGDRGGATGACGETCLKMIDQYLTGREIPISAIIANGDNNPNITTIAGMIKAAKWLGWDLKYYYDANSNDIYNWLNEGKLLIPVIKYSLFPGVYKQDLVYGSGHFILITGMTDDKRGIRFADPNFIDGTLHGNPGKRNDGFRDNNKWADWSHFERAFNHGDGNISRNGAILVAEPKEVTTPPPPVDPCEAVKIERDTLITKLSVSENDLTNERSGRTEDAKTHEREVADMKDQFEEQVDNLVAKHNAEMRGAAERFEKELNEKRAEIGEQEELKDKAIEELRSANELIDGQQRIISALKNTAVKDHDVSMLFSLLIYKLWLKAKGADK